MSNFTTIPLENQFRTQTVGELLDSTTVPFVLTLKKAPSFTLAGGAKCYVVLEPGTSKEEGMRVSAINGLELTIDLRGLPKYKGGPVTTGQHGGGSTIIISNNWQTYDDVGTAILSKYDKTGGILTGPIQFTDANIQIREDGNDLKFKDQNQAEVSLSQLAAAAGLDEKSKVSIADTTSNYLFSKLEEGDNVSIEIVNPGGDEKARISANPLTGTYAVDSVGTDAYAITLNPALSAYVDGRAPLIFEPGTPNTGPATINIDTLGAIPLKKGNYSDLIDGDLFKGLHTEISINVKSVTFTAGLLLGATSGTLTGNWGYKTGVYSVKFSNGDVRDVTLTNAATSATWTGGLSADATVNAQSRYAQLLSPTAGLSGGNNASEEHWHDLLINNSKALRHFFRFSDMGLVNGVGGGAVGDQIFGTTDTNNNAIANMRILHRNKSGVGTSTAHDKNPAFRGIGSWLSNTAQEGFLGFVDSSIVGTSLENSAMTLSHFGFIVQDGTLFISVADGATQSKLDISALVADVSAGHTFMAKFDGVTASFFVDNVSVGTRTLNVPTADLTSFQAVAIADVSAASRQFDFATSGWVAWDE